jgi:hypothetical protein
MKHQQYTIYSDPGHAWLKVSMQELADLGLTHKITGYSYRKGNMAYLEEDCDLATFYDAKEQRGIKVTFAEVYQDPTPIRSYPYYRA